MMQLLAHMLLQHSPTCFMGPKIPLYNSNYMEDNDNNSKSLLWGFRNKLVLQNHSRSDKHISSYEEKNIGLKIIW